MYRIGLTRYIVGPKWYFIDLWMYRIGPIVYFARLTVYHVGPRRYVLRPIVYRTRLTMTQDDPTTSLLPHVDALELVEAASSELVASQRKLAQICGIDRRVVAKWVQGRQRPYPWHWESMARAVHPRNAALAARLAAAGGHTLVSLGLQAPATASQA